MTVTRGDRKPCIYSGCSGTMQFARQATGREAQGWVCSTTANHFHRPLGTPPVGAGTEASALRAVRDADRGEGEK